MTNAGSAIFTITVGGYNVATNYQRGYAQERFVKDRLEKAGMYVQRSGGSKGTFDLIAVPMFAPVYPFSDYPLLIQVKSLRVKSKAPFNISRWLERPATRNNLKDLERVSDNLRGARAVVAFVLIQNRRRSISLFRFSPNHNIYLFLRGIE